MLDSEAIAKTQAITMIVIIMIAAVVGTTAFVLWINNNGTPDTTKIGILADLEFESDWHVAVVAAEEINAEGGILGKQVEIIKEDVDPQGQDVLIYINVLERLLTYHKVDFIVGKVADKMEQLVQELSVQHNMTITALPKGVDELTQRIIDDYGKVKYFFRINENATSPTQDTDDVFQY